MTDWGALLHATADHAARYLDDVDERPVGPPVQPDTLRARLGADLPDGPTDPRAVLDELVDAVDPGLVASQGPRYFGFVTGGALPAALAADWMTSAWDQNGGLYVMSPAATVVEETAARWLVELFALAPETSVGFVTGTTMANLTGLAAARIALLARAGHDLERHGARGAPALRIVAGDERHNSIEASLRLLGIGADEVALVATDDQGAMDPDALATHLDRGDGPALVIAQAGNVNTGACDPLDAIADACERHDAWLHVDGAFGLWARLDPNRAHLVAGLERAHSLATDAHKWLNVPYDGAMVFVRDPAAHRAATYKGAAYLMGGDEDRRDNYMYTPEASRRARATTVYAALRSLGRTGVSDLVQRTCDLAERFARAAAQHPRISILNDVVLNQVLLAFDGVDLDALLRAVHEDGTFWAGRTVWRDRAAMRISVSGWRTTEDDIDRCVGVLLRLTDGAG